MHSNIVWYSQCRIQQFLWLPGFWRALWEEKLFCSWVVLGEAVSLPQWGPGAKPWKIFGFFAFWIAQDRTLWNKCMSVHLSNLRLINFYTFESLGVWVWDPKPVNRLQSSSGYGTGSMHLIMWVYNLIWHYGVLDLIFEYCLILLTRHLQENSQTCKIISFLGAKQSISNSLRSRCFENRYLPFAFNPTTPPCLIKRYISLGTYSSIFPFSSFWNCVLIMD